MIPGDLASRLRTLLESSVQPLSVIHEIPANLPRFETGQRFMAQIQNPLPDGSFQALVAGKSMTLALPETAKSGDVLELIVTGRQGNTVQARQIPSLPLAEPRPSDSPKPILSQTGLLISQLLTGRFGEAKPVALSPGASLLPAPPKQASDFVPVLKQAISQSGLFYESHLRQWVEGKLTLSNLKQEPQAQLAPLPDPARPQTSQTSETSTLIKNSADANTKAVQAVLPDAQEPVRSTSEKDLPGNVKDINSPRQASAHEALAETADRPAISKTVAEPLMPVVQQQLEALASHQMSWAGQAWPGMPMQWEILNPDQQHAASDTETEPVWRSSLRLQLPRMGDIQAQLILGPQGLTVRIDTDDGVAAQRMRVASTELQAALEAAGVSVHYLQVSEHASA